MNNYRLLPMRRKSNLLQQFKTLIAGAALLALPEIGAATNLIPLTTGQSAPLHALGAALQAPGWQVKKSADGSLLVSSGKNLEGGDALTRGFAQEKSVFDDTWFRHRLAQTGWGVRRSEDDSVLLYPGAARRPGLVLGREKVKDQLTDRIDIASWRAQLSGHGWQVSQDGEGGVLLIPGSAKQSEQIRAASNPKSPNWMDAASWREALSNHGWVAEEDRDGGLFLSPSSVRAAEPAIVAVNQEASMLIDAAFWRARLLPHGWGVEEDSQGNVTLYPGAAVSNASSFAGSGYENEGQIDSVTKLAYYSWRGTIRADSYGTVLLVPDARGV